MSNMVLRDVITQIKSEKESDGMGGFTSKNEIRTQIDCKASLNTSPEAATAYGPAGEQVLYVVTREELDKEAFFLFKEKKYTVRFQANNGRLFTSTLVEVKKGA